MVKINIACVIRINKKEAKERDDCSGNCAKSQTDIQLKRRIVSAPCKSGESRNLPLFSNRCAYFKHNIFHSNTLLQSKCTRALISLSLVHHFNNV